MTKSPRAGTVRHRKCCKHTLCLGFLVWWLATWCRSNNLYLLVDKRQVIRHALRTQNKVKGESHPVFLLVNHSKACPNRLQSSENHKLTDLWDHLKQQAYKTHGCVLCCAYPPYENDTRQRERKTILISGREKINQNKEYTKQKA